jgi:hypothetical protein
MHIPPAWRPVANFLAVISSVGQDSRMSSNTSRYGNPAQRLWRNPVAHILCNDKWCEAPPRRAWGAHA